MILSKNDYFINFTFSFTLCINWLFGDDQKVTLTDKRFLFFQDKIVYSKFTDLLPKEMTNEDDPGFVSSVS